ncbi:MAG: sugar transferase [Bacteroidetes bacterium]|nr:sugar transferase [Bacteroidota bacterium]
MKRIFDLVLAVLFIIILSPLMVLISLYIILDSPGGVIFRQSRVGKNNRDFTILKFRTMFTDFSEKGLLTIGSGDARITRAGRTLRKYKLDEIPQLFNILSGNMSFVGPRPEVRKYVELYDEEQKKILSVRPGLTDYASLQFIRESDILGNSPDPEETYIHYLMPEKLKLNLLYIQSQSILTDLKIILKTVWQISPLFKDRVK